MNWVKNPLWRFLCSPSGVDGRKIKRWPYVEEIFGVMEGDLDVGCHHADEMVWLISQRNGMHQKVRR